MESHIYQPALLPPPPNPPPLHPAATPALIPLLAAARIVVVHEQHAVLRQQAHQAGRPALGPPQPVVLAVLGRLCQGALGHEVEGGSPAGGDDRQGQRRPGWDVGCRALRGRVRPATPRLQPPCTHLRCVPSTQPCSSRSARPRSQRSSGPCQSRSTQNSPTLRPVGPVLQSTYVWMYCAPNLRVGPVSVRPCDEQPQRTAAGRAGVGVAGEGRQLAWQPLRNGQGCRPCSVAQLTHARSQTSSPRSRRRAAASAASRTARLAAAGRGSGAAARGLSAAAPLFWDVLHRTAGECCLSSNALLASKQAGSTQLQTCGLLWSRSGAGTKSSPVSAWPVPLNLTSPPAAGVDSSAPELQDAGLLATRAGPARTCNGPAAPVDARAGVLHVVPELAPHAALLLVRAPTAQAGIAGRSCGCASRCSLPPPARLQPASLRPPPPPAELHEPCSAGGPVGHRPTCG